MRLFVERERAYDLRARDKSDGVVGLGTLLCGDLQGGEADVRNNQNTPNKTVYALMT